VRRPPYREVEQITDLVLQYPVGRQPDRVANPFGFEELVILWIRKGRIGAKIETLHGVSVAGDHRLQHPMPTISAVNVAWPQDAPWQVLPKWPL
jgi:hypothetical protein